MSLFYAETNNESTKDLFEKRTIYQGTTLALNENNLVDFNWGEKYYYGRVYRDLVPICLRENTLKSLSYTGNRGQTLQAVNYVLDGFNEMALQFEKASMLKNIVPNDPYLSTLKVYRAYDSPYVQYRSHKRAYFASLASFFKKNRIRFSNFDEFIKELMPLIEGTTKASKFTFPGFLKSGDCTVLASGLALEIADLSYENDDEKVKQFLESPNWQFYINACDTYGFMVDSNIPWRIVADIDSELTTEIGARYGMPNLETVFSRAYKSAPIVNLRSFSQDLLALYDACKVRNYKKAVIRNGCTTYKKIYPTRYTLSTLLREQGVIQMMKYYLRIRLYEEQPELTPIEANRLITKTVDIGKARSNYARAVKNFEVVINKEFDKRRSFEYIKRHLEAKAEDLFRKELLQAFEPDSPEVLEMLETEASFNEYINSGESLANEGTQSAVVPETPSYLESHTGANQTADRQDSPSTYGASIPGQAAIQSLQDSEDIPDL